MCWLLTVDDGRTDGRLTDYLDRPDRWRHHDPALFDVLRDCLPPGWRRDPAGRRDLGHVGQRGLLPGARFFGETLTDDPTARRAYTARMLAALDGTDVVFFDPDNGLEVPSKPSGTRGSCKYAYWSELLATWRRGQSLLVYQHFPREHRAAFLDRIAAEARERTCADDVRAFRTAHVAFLAIVQAAHADGFDRATTELARRWAGQIVPWQPGAPAAASRPG